MEQREVVVASEARADEIINKIAITLTEYVELMDRSIKLSCLEACGVDNWDGYEEAMEMYAEQPR